MQAPARTGAFLFGALVAASALGFSAGCDAHQFGQIEPPEITGLSPEATRAGNNITVLAENVDLTPWMTGDVPPNEDEPEPLLPLPYELTVTVDGESAEVRSVSPGGVSIRVPEHLEPGRYAVVVFVEGVPSNTEVLEIIEEPLLQITIAPDPLVVSVGATRALAVYALDGNGEVIDVTADAAVELMVPAGAHAPAVLTEDGVAGVVPGTAALRATVGLLLDDAAVEIVAGDGR